MVLVMYWALGLQKALCLLALLICSAGCCPMPRAPTTFLALLLNFKATVLKALGLEEA